MSEQPEDIEEEYQEEEEEEQQQQQEESSVAHVIYSCQDCGRIFPTIEELDHHEKTVH